MAVRPIPWAFLRRLPVVLGACAAMHAAAAQASWFEPVVPGVPQAVRIEVDAASLADHGFGPELALRVTPAQPRTHARGFDFASFLAVVRLDCEAESLVPIAVSYFGEAAGQGDLVGTGTDLSTAGIDPTLLADVDPAVRSALLRGACQSGAYGSRPTGRPAGAARP